MAQVDFGLGFGGLFGLYVEQPPIRRRKACSSAMACSRLFAVPLKLVVGVGEMAHALRLGGSASFFTLYWSFAKWG